MIWLVLAVVVVGAGWFWFFYLDHRTPQEVMDAEDGNDLLKRWARVAYVGVNGKFDPARSGEKQCRDALKRDWDISDKAGIETQDAELAGTSNNNVAWDHVRRLLLGRLAVGANLIDEAHFARIASHVKQTLNTAYSSWEGVTTDYRKGLASWSGNDQDRLDSWDFNVKECSQPLWTIVTFK